jgi:hypothetical protein
MMQEVINITPDMMHKYYNHLDNHHSYNNSFNNSYNHSKDKLGVVDKYNKNQKNEIKFVLAMIFFIPLFMYIVSSVSSV